ncbi:MAG: hypothetical protein NTY96_02130 [Bacteroidetes bacterium]|nr:hypothetical protein [Bacteroidota bacterium]
MASTKKVISGFAILAALILLIACGSKDNSTPAPARNTTYSLKVKDVLGVTGTVTFTETSSTLTTISIALTGAPSGTHPAELCMNSAVEGGTVVVELNPVDATGKSSTAVPAMPYTQLIAYDGFIKVVKSSSEPGIILAMGDIGGNVITGTNKTYKLDTIGGFGVSGTALFEKRVNGSTLVTITLTGAIAGELYPATINLGSIANVGGGPVVVTLSNVNGTTGKSYTNIRKLDSGIVITYDNWLVYAGYINIYQTAVTYGNIICHGNIGSN